MRFERFDELQIKSELEPFVIRLEKFCEKTDQKESDRWVSIQKILDKLEADNTEDLIRSIMMTFRATGNQDYMELYRRICKAITISGKDEYFVKWTDEIPYPYLFGRNYKNFTESAKEIVDNLEFNGQIYTVEEFIRLSTEATLINQDLLYFVQNKQKMLNYAKHDNKTKDEFFARHQILNIELQEVRNRDDQ